MTKEKSSLKIAVIGSQCTGKSCLSEVLSEKLNLPLITEVARNFKKEQLNSDNLEYLKIQKQILELQLYNEGLHSSFISDRSTIDNLAYYLNGCAFNTTYEENCIYFEKSLSNVENYTHIFYLKPEFEIVSDNFRSCDKEYQKDIDYIIGMILYMFNIKHHMLSGSIEARLGKAMEIIYG